MREKRAGVKLTDAKLRAMPAGAPVITVAGIIGLQFQPSAKTKGCGAWIYRFTAPDGRRTKRTIGRYPAMGLAAAMDMIRELQTSVEDPRQVLDAVQQPVLPARSWTFEEVARHFHAEQMQHKAWRNERYAAQWLRESENLIFPTLGAMPIAEVTADHVKDAVLPHWARIPDTAKKLIDRVGQVFAHASIELQIVDHDPTPVARARLKRIPQHRKPRAERHHAAMEWRSVPAYVANVLLVGGQSVSKRALLFLILTAARSGAVRQMRQSEVGFSKQTWTIPGGGVDRKIVDNVELPLDARLCAMLRDWINPEAPEGLVFPSGIISKTTGYVLSDMALTSFLRKTAREYPTDIAGRCATAHGFRSSFKRWSLAQGYDDLLGEAQLTHIVGDATRNAYVRGEAAIERRAAMMTAWIDYCYSEIQ